MGQPLSGIGLGGRRGEHGPTAPWLRPPALAELMTPHAPGTEHPGVTGGRSSMGGLQRWGRHARMTMKCEAKAPQAVQQSCRSARLCSHQVGDQSTGQTPEALHRRSMLQALQRGSGCFDGRRSSPPPWTQEGVCQHGSPDAAPGRRHRTAAWGRAVLCGAHGR